MASVNLHTGKIPMAHRAKVTFTKSNVRLHLRSASFFSALPAERGTGFVDQILPIIRVSKKIEKFLLPLALSCLLYAMPANGQPLPKMLTDEYTTAEATHGSPKETATEGDSCCRITPERHDVAKVSRAHTSELIVGARLGFILGIFAYHFLSTLSWAVRRYLRTRGCSAKECNQDQ